MTASFRFVALGAERFEGLFELGDDAVKAMGGRRMIVDARPGFPCRVSLADAEIGETVLLLPFTHHDVASPYRASGPIFVRQGAATAQPAIGEIPGMFHRRLLSLRSYDAHATMVGAEVTEGEAPLRDAIARAFARPEVRYLHIHNARPGCFNCAVERA